jgi:hypothetical protein
MMSLFTGANSAVTTSSDSTSMVPLTVVREMLKEVAKTREENLAFRAAVSEHEAENTKTISKSPLGQASSGRGGRGGNGKMLPSNKSDLRVRLPSLSIPRRVPRSINSQIAWDTVKIRYTYATSMSAITENNFPFSLSAHPQQTSWTTLFDQWCIPMASVTFYSQQAPGSTGSVLELHTALDFDNTNNLGSISQIDDFGSSQVDMIVLNKSVTRSIKPSVKLNSGSTNNATLARQWCDSSYSSIQWYGIRSIAAIAVTSVVAYTAEMTIVFAFRNAI